MGRHPIAERLRGVWLKKDASPAEIKAEMDAAQLALEQLYDADTVPNSGTVKCAQSGCNYRRYPASRFCMYHVTGGDTLAARLRRAEAARR